jgi:hypothetical protein
MDLLVTGHSAAALHGQRPVRPPAQAAALDIHIIQLLERQYLLLAKYPAPQGTLYLPLALLAQLALPVLIVPLQL